jgi:hypothetical protein
MTRCGCVSPSRGSQGYPRGPREGSITVFGMWDIVTWHNGTLAIAWWFFIVLVVVLIAAGGSAAARR